MHRFYVRFHVTRKILFRVDAAGAWSRFDAGAWSPVDVDVEAFLSDPFVDELDADQAGALEVELVA